MHGRAAGGRDEPSLADSFWLVARELRRLARASSAPWDIAPSQARALRVLGRHGIMRLNELSEHLHIAARSATEVVDALQERGLARRQRDPHDRRAVLVESTAEGLAVLAALREARSSQADAYFERLNETDRRALARILGRLRPDEDQLP